MEKLNFVDADLHQLPETANKSDRYAVDLGVRSFFGGGWLPGKNSHCFVSAIPWITGVNKKDANAFVKKLEKLNPGVEFDLLELRQISLLNILGKEQGFKILNCWTCTTQDDWHGRVDGFYSLKNGREVIDWGKNKTDVYIVFAFVPGQEKSIIRP